MRRLVLPLMICTPLWLTGCDMLGIEGAGVLAARKEAEGKAVGGACRHAGRAIEDCYTQNKKAEKAAVFAGWREMNDYMRENKIDTVAAAATGATDAAGQADDKADVKTEAKAGDKPAPKAAAEHKS